MTLRTRVAILLGGAIGTALRLVLTGLPVVAGIPTGTLLANLAGTLVLGVLAVRLAGASDPTKWSPVTAGLLGATTTFSTFILEVVQGWANDPAAMATYVVVTLVLGLAMASIGRWLGMRRRDHVSGAHT